jgi:hypothetical protein
VGQAVTVEVSSNDQTSRPERIQLFPPDETSPVPLNLSPEATDVTITDVARSGVYWIRGLDAGSGFSANLSDAATALERIELGDLDQIFGPDQYDLATDREGIEVAENKASQRVSLHSPAILFVLIVFLLEQVLGNRFYGRQGA